MTLIPTDMKFHQQSRKLEIVFDNGQAFELPYEFLRVYSPSAEVRGHGLAEPILQVGKRHVNVSHVEPAGEYALKISFDDGHDSGLYSWEYLHHLGVEYPQLWQQYLQRLEQAGASRD